MAIYGKTLVFLMIAAGPILFPLGPSAAKPSSFDPLSGKSISMRASGKSVIKRNIKAGRKLGRYRVSSRGVFKAVRQRFAPPLPPIRPAELSMTNASPPVDHTGSIEPVRHMASNAEFGIVLDPAPVDLSELTPALVNVAPIQNPECQLSEVERRRRMARDIPVALFEEADNAALIVEAAIQHSAPPDLALAVAYHESRIDTCAASPTGVKGVMQMTESTAEWLGFDRDVNADNIQAGVKFLARIVRTCGRSYYRCLAARYNGSTRRERRRWAAGVRSAHREIEPELALRIAARVAARREQVLKTVHMATAGSLL
jgi:soluble lytic murein transglycosylase-like protein